MPPSTALISTLNGGIEAFARAAGVAIPRDQRVKVVCPPLVKETAEKMGWGANGMSAIRT